MAAIKVNGITLEYESVGDPNAPSILLIMGLGMQLIAWPDAFCAALAGRGFRVIRFDNRDIGLSSKFDAFPIPNVAWVAARAWLGLPIRSAYTLADMANDTVGLMDALGLDRAHVAGASMGGMVAQLIAALHPTRISSLISMMSSSGARRLPGPTPRALAALLGKPDNPHEFASVIEHYIHLFRVIGSPGFATDEEELRARLGQALRRNFHPAGNARQLHAILACGDRSPLLQQITAPTLVIHGADDPLVPLECGKDTARKIAGARLHVVQGMGHDLAPGLHPILVAAIAEHCHAAQSSYSTSPLEGVASIATAG
jgi:pimeloyl-ACP methyl ester carboxylesterase